MQRTQIRIGFIGGGPRAVGIIERLIANADLLPPAAALDLVVVDPFPAGPGRIWRYDQSPSLKMNSLAEDVAVFTDQTCQIEGPVVPGPTLAQWVELVNAKTLPFTPPDPAVAAELETFGPQSFATRRLFSCYMRWFLDHVRASAPPAIAMREIPGVVTAVSEQDDGYLLSITDSAGRRFLEDVDLVVYAVGHADTEPSAAEQQLALRTAAHGLHYWPANYAYDVDLDAIPAAQPVLVRGLGLSFIDIVVRLTLDRGGAEVVDPTQPPGWRTTYVPSGREPRLFAGSRRGVPYHAKITSHFHGERPGLVTTFVTREALEARLNAPGEVDFDRDIWPLIVREMAYWHYREIFTGHPERVRRPWSEIAALLLTHELDSEPVIQALNRAVAPADIFTIDALDRPLAGVSVDSLAAFQSVLSTYLHDDIALRESESHSETLAIFWATLASYVTINETLGHPGWSLRSRLESIPRRWHDFFSYLDSGPPAARLELVLALQRSHLLTFIGGDLMVRLPEHHGQFVATSGNHPEQVSARFLIDGFHPERTIAQSANPALRDLIASGQGFEQLLASPAGPVSTRRLAVAFEHGNILQPDGKPHARRFAVGDFTSSPPAGAFSRPNTNARIFRENDRIARNLLTVAAALPARSLAPALTA